MAEKYTYGETPSRKQIEDAIEVLKCERFARWQTMMTEQEKEEIERAHDLCIFMLRKALTKGTVSTTVSCPTGKSEAVLTEKREWIEGYRGRWYRKIFSCPSCGKKIRTESWDEKRCFGAGTILTDGTIPKYCPECGLKLEEAKHDQMEKN